jgi:hypothetical protein
MTDHGESATGGQAAGTSLHDSIEVVIPDFAADAETVASYDAAREGYEQEELAVADSAVRSVYSRKKSAAQAEVTKAKQALDESRAAAEQTWSRYARHYPHRVHRNQLQSPSFFEILFSFFGASQKYRAATRSVEKHIAAMTLHRRRQREEEEVEEWLARSLQRLRSDLRERLQTPNGLDPFHTRPEIAPLWIRVQEIRSEREGFAIRLAANAVSIRELRDRTLRERQIAPLRPPFEGAMIVDLSPFGEAWCWVFSDSNNQLFWLPYDARLQTLADWVFDTYLLVDVIEAKFTRSPEGRRVTTLDRYMDRYPKGDEAKLEMRKRAAALRVQGERAQPSGLEDEDEQRLIEILASLAEASPTIHSGD